jgi:copper chaperone CopZ
MAMLLALMCAVQEDVNTLTLVFEKMHCDECKLEVEARVRKVPGFVSVTFLESTALVLVAEKAPPPVIGGLPKDLRLKAQQIQIRGTVNASGDKLTLVAKGSGATLALAGDKLAELKKALGGKNRFRLTGALAAGGKTLTLDSFQAADWKD